MVNPREDRQATEREREDLGPASFLSLIWKASDLGHPVTWGITFLSYSLYSFCDLPPPPKRLSPKAWPPDGQLIRVRDL